MRELFFCVALPRSLPSDCSESLGFPITGHEAIQAGVPHLCTCVCGRKHVRMCVPLHWDLPASCCGVVIKITLMFWKT
jgi:hypothetical protein